MKTYIAGAAAAAAVAAAAASAPWAADGARFAGAVRSGGLHVAALLEMVLMTWLLCDLARSLARGGNGGGGAPTGTPDGARDDVAMGVDAVAAPRAYVAVRHRLVGFVGAALLLSWPLGLYAAAVELAAARLPPAAAAVAAVAGAGALLRLAAGAALGDGARRAPTPLPAAKGWARHGADVERVRRRFSAFLAARAPGQKVALRRSRSGANESNRTIDPSYKASATVVDVSELDAVVEVDAEAMLMHVEPGLPMDCLLYTSPSPRDKRQSRMPSSA